MRRIGELFGDYLLQGELGTGANGVVFQAQQLSLNRLVALKIFQPDALRDGSARRRFRIEAEAAARLDHPHIVPVHELGEWDGQVFLSMKLLTGGTLAEALADRTPTATETAALLVPLARAVDHAHSRGVLHRDIKPGNILLDEAGQPCLADFGLAKLRQGAQALTATQTTLGTPAYLAPEVATGGAQAATTRTDLYGLGAVLYQMLTGRPPHVGENPLLVLERVKTSDPPAPRELRPTVPRDLELICLKCLAREPAQRYASAGELADDLEQFARGEPVSAREPTLPELLMHGLGRHRVAATVAGVAVVCLLAGFAATFWQWQRAEGFLLDARASNTRLITSLALAEQREAENLTGRGQFHSAVLKLAELLRENPSNRLARVRLNAALTEDDWPWPLLAPLRHGGPVCQGVFHPDNEHLLTASNDGLLHVWNRATGERRFTRPHDAGRGPFALSRDGRFAATLTANGKAQVWRLPDGARVFDVNDEGPMRNDETRAKYEIRFVAFNATATLLITAATDGRAALWSVSDGRCLATVDHGEPLRQAGLDAAGHRLLTLGAVTCKLWPLTNVSPFVVRHSPFVLSPSAPPTHAEFSPDGARLLTVASNIVELWTTQTGALERRVRHPAGVVGAHFTPDGQRLVPFGAGAWVQDIRAESQEDLYLPHDAPMTQCSFSGDAQFVALASEDGIVRLRSIPASEEILRPVRHEGPVLDAALNADGTRLLTCSADGTARLWIARRPTLEFPLTSPVPARPLDFSPDGNLLATEGTDRTLRLFFVGDRTKIHQVRTPIPHTQPVGRLAFTPDGRHLATVDTSGQFLVAEAAGTNDLRLPPLNSPATVLWWSRDNSKLAACTTNEVVVWDLGQRPPRLLARTNLPSTAEAAFSPAGWHLAITVADASAPSPVPPATLTNPLAHSASPFTLHGSRLTNHASRITPSCCWISLTVRSRPACFPNPLPPPASLSAPMDACSPRPVPATPSGFGAPTRSAQREWTSCPARLSSNSASAPIPRAFSRRCSTAPSSSGRRARGVSWRTCPPHGARCVTPSSPRITNGCFSSTKTSARDSGMSKRACRQATSCASASATARRGSAATDAASSASAPASAPCCNARPGPSRRLPMCSWRWRNI